MATDRMFAHRIVPVVVIDDAATARPLAEAMVTGGLPVAEVTFRTAAAPDAIAAMRDVDGLVLGAGTVVTPEQARVAVDCGATFLVSPGLRPDVVEQAHALGVPILPGCVTPSEIMQAMSYGIDTVKFFPAGVYGGAAAIKALSAPFGGIRFVPTGGVSAANLADFLSLSCIPAVGGSWMVPADRVRAGDYAGITRLCAEAVAAAAAL